MEARPCNRIPDFTTSKAPPKIAIVLHPQDHKGIDDTLLARAVYALTIKPSASASDLNMAQQIQLDYPCLSRHRHQERVEAVNYVLADMQQLLPTEIESNTLAAMRDYMVTELGQFQPFAQLLLRSASIKILIKDATDRLLQLGKQAQDLQTDLDVGGLVREEILQRNSISRENAALKAQLVTYDVEFMTLRTENQLLKQTLERYKNILQRNVEREQAREMTEVQERGNELEEERAINRELSQECERTKHILHRVEAERDHAKRALAHQNQEFQELQLRFRETEEKPYQSFRQSRQDLTTTCSPQKPAATEGGMLAFTGILTPTNSQTTNRDEAHLCGSGSRSTTLEYLGQHVGEEDKSSENCTDGKTATKNPSGATSMKKSGSSRIVVPIVPRLPQKPIVHANPAEKQERDGNPSQK